MWFRDLISNQFLLTGISSWLWAQVLKTIIAVIVCKDAMGVRLETGKQAAIINEIVRAFDELSSGKLTDVKLKEFVGHTPIQVLAGILLGIVNAVLLHLFIFP